LPEVIFYPPNPPQFGGGGGGSRAYIKNEYNNNTLVEMAYEQYRQEFL
jgi:GTPase involved in cell partitioning and DNA repair